MFIFLTNNLNIKKLTKQNAIRPTYGEQETLPLCYLMERQNNHNPSQ